MKAGEQDDEKTEGLHDPPGSSVPHSLLYRSGQDREGDGFLPQHPQKRQLRQQGRWDPEGRRDRYHQGHFRQLLQDHLRRQVRIRQQEIYQNHELLRQQLFWQQIVVEHKEELREFRRDLRAGRPGNKILKTKEND